jgi:hypothetical protein
MPIRTKISVSIFFRNSITAPEIQITTFETLADALQSLIGE